MADIANKWDIVAVGQRSQRGSLTSWDDGSRLDHVRTTIMALQIYAEGNHEDVDRMAARPGAEPKA